MACIKYLTRKGGGVMLERNATQRNSLAVSYYPIKKTLCMSVPIFGMLMHSVFLFVIEKESL